MTMRPAKRQLRPASSAQFLYLAEARTEGRCWVKVGLSSELMGRATFIACGCPIPIKTIWYREIGRRDVCEWAEKAIHAVLHEHWSSGEWFQIECNAELRGLVDGICKQFAEPAEWQCLKLEDSLWRRPKNRGQKLSDLADRRAAAIRQRISFETAPRQRRPESSLVESMVCYRSK
jgi:hypothetical protein